MMRRIGTEHTAIAWQWPQQGAATGAPVKNQSGVSWDVQTFGKAALRTSERGLCDDAIDIHAALSSKMSFTHDSAAIVTGKPVVGIASSTTWRIDLAL